MMYNYLLHGHFTKDPHSGFFVRLKQLRACANVNYEELLRVVDYSYNNILFDTLKNVTDYIKNHILVDISEKYELIIIAISSGNIQDTNIFVQKYNVKIPVSSDSEKKLYKKFFNTRRNNGIVFIDRNGRIKFIKNSFLEQRLLKQLIEGHIFED